MVAQFGKLLIAQRMRVARHGFGQPQGSFFGGGEIAALLPLGKVAS